MKKIIASFFLILFVGLSWQQATLFGMYLLNKKYITEQFCVNTDKPELKCNGKCHLKDAIAQQSENEQNPDLAQNLIIPVYKSNNILEFPKPELLVYVYHLKEVVLLNTYECKLFQPPQI